MIQSRVEKRKREDILLLGNIGRVMMAQTRNEGQGLIFVEMEAEF